MLDYYQQNYDRAKAEQADAEREGDCIRAEACRQAALRWLEMGSRAEEGLPDEEEQWEDPGPDLFARDVPDNYFGWSEI